MSELTLKTNRAKGDTRPFYRAGIEVPSVWTRMAMPEDSDARKDAIIRLKKESMVLVADAMKPAELVKIISNLEDSVQIKAIMAASKVKIVEAAGKERIAIFNPGGEEGAEVEKKEPPLVNQGKDTPPTKDDILTKISEASTLEDLKALDDMVTAFKGSQDYLKVIQDAYEARKKELAA